ncbi:MAG: hypothetical protein V3V18_11600 [Methylococcales bacterium]
METTTLKLRRVAIDTYKENVAYLHRDCEFYRSEGFQALNKIEVSSAQNGNSVIAVLNIVDDVASTGYTLEQTARAVSSYAPNSLSVL